MVPTLLPLSAIAHIMLYHQRLRGNLAGNLRQSSSRSPGVCVDIHSSINAWPDPPEAALVVLAFSPLRVTSRHSTQPQMLKPS